MWVLTAKEKITQEDMRGVRPEARCWQVKGREEGGISRTGC